MAKKMGLDGGLRLATLAGYKHTAFTVYGYLFPLDSSMIKAERCPVCEYICMT